MPWRRVSAARAGAARWGRRGPVPGGAETPRQRRPGRRPHLGGGFGGGGFDGGAGGAGGAGSAHAQRPRRARVSLSRARAQPARWRPRPTAARTAPVRAVPSPGNPARRRRAGGQRQSRGAQLGRAWKGCGVRLLPKRDVFALFNVRRLLKSLGSLPPSPRVCRHRKSEPAARALSVPFPSLPAGLLSGKQPWQLGAPRTALFALCARRSQPSCGWQRAPCGADAGVRATWRFLVLRPYPIHCHL